MKQYMNHFQPTYSVASSNESAPPNIYDRWSITPGATFEWTINNYTETIVANNTIWLEDGHNMMIGIHNYFEGYHN